MRINIRHYLHQTLYILIVPAFLFIIAVILFYLDNDSFGLFHLLTLTIGGSIGLWGFWLTQSLKETKKQKAESELYPKVFNKSMNKALIFALTLAVILAVVVIYY